MVPENITKVAAENCIMLVRAMPVQVHTSPFLLRTLSATSSHAT
jgi:hypothetical protein